MIRVFDLVNVGLLLFEKTGDLIVLFAEFRQKVLGFLVHSREVCRVL